VAAFILMIITIDRYTGYKKQKETSRSDLSDCWRFPSLERLFEKDNPGSLPAMRAQLTHTSQLLERVIRQGSKSDASRAEQALRAWELTLSFLNEVMSDEESAEC
jgi:hypothetical protein